jgi:hypothetical protein
MSILLIPAAVSLRSQIGSRGIVPELSRQQHQITKGSRGKRDSMPTRISIKRVKVPGAAFDWTISGIDSTIGSSKNLWQYCAGWMRGTESSTSQKRITHTTSFLFCKLEHRELSTLLFRGILNKLSSLIKGNVDVDFWTAVLALFRRDGGYRMKKLKSEIVLPINQWNENDSVWNKYQWQWYGLERQIYEVAMDIRVHGMRNRWSKRSSQPTKIWQGACRDIHSFDMNEIENIYFWI